MKNRQILIRAAQAVAFLFAAFGGFLKNVAPPEEATAGFAIGLASALTLCILLLLSTLLKERAGTAGRKLWLGVAGALSVVGLASGLWYLHERGQLTFSYPPDNPQAEYIAGTKYTSAAAVFAAKHLNASQIVAKFGGLPNRHLVWSNPSVDSARMILVVSYLLFVLSLAGAIFGVVEINGQ